MANEISGIRMKQNYQLGGIDEKPQDKTSKQEDSKPQAEQKQVSAEDTLKFMNAQSMNARPAEQPRVLNISKYVTPEQMQRIIGSVLNFFEPEVESYFTGINAELGNALSEEAKMDLAVQMFEQANL